MNQDEVSENVHPWHFQGLISTPTINAEFRISPILTRKQRIMHSTEPSRSLLAVSRSFQESDKEEASNPRALLPACVD